MAIVPGVLYGTFCRELKLTGCAQAAVGPWWTPEESGHGPNPDISILLVRSRMVQPPNETDASPVCTT